MARNRNLMYDVRYTIQQNAIKEVCVELGLIAYYPNYHASKRDNNSVLVYTKEAHEYNKKLPDWASSSENKPYVCHFENSDINGLFDLNWMNHGKIDLRTGLDVKSKIKEFITKSLESVSK